MVPEKRASMRTAKLPIVPRLCLFHLPEDRERGRENRGERKEGEKKEKGKHPYTPRSLTPDRPPPAENTDNNQ